MAGDVNAQRLALRYEPPAIIVEYTRKQSYRLQLYHHEIDLQNWLSPSRRSDLSAWEASDIVEQLVKLHGKVLDGVSPQQLKRLVKKLASVSSTKQDPRSVLSSRESLAPLPQADYNRVSEAQLRQVKEKMNTVFEQNIVRPGDKGYQYDKQVSFAPTQEASDWDDDE